MMNTATLISLLWVLGIAGLIVEFSAPGLFFPGALGTFFLGLALYGMQILPLTFIILGSICLFGMAYLGWKSHRKRARLASQSGSLVGLHGRVIYLEQDSLNGQMQTQGEIWAIHSVSPLTLGMSVTITKAEGLVLTVQPLHPKE
jgi:membrane-bound serine protease (ClpP class)